MRIEPKWNPHAESVIELIERRLADAEVEVKKAEYEALYKRERLNTIKAILIDAKKNGDAE